MSSRSLIENTMPRAMASLTRDGSLHEGTLDGTVSAEMEISPSARGIASVVERDSGSGENLYRNWQDRPLDR